MNICLSSFQGQQSKNRDEEKDTQIYNLGCHQNVWKESVAGTEAGYNRMGLIIENGVLWKLTPPGDLIIGS